MAGNVPEVIVRRLALALLLVAVVVIGCGSGNAVSKANLEKIKVGMTISEVTAVLGKPTQILTMGGPETGHYIWLTGDRKHGINIGFKDGKVGSKQWIVSSRAGK